MDGQPPRPTCRLCDSPTRTLFHAAVLGKYQTAYHRCERCGFLQTDPPHWLQEAYARPITRTDTGVLARNARLADLATCILYVFFDRRGRFLDYAGGYGIFTRLMRDRGFDYYWHDVHAPNLLAEGFEYRPDAGAVELLSTFESFEHFVEPRQELGKMLEISRNVLFSTELLPDPVPAPDAWWYYAPEHGQHVSFYSLRSLHALAGRHGLRLYSNGRSLHLFTDRRISRLAWWLVLKSAPRGLAALVRRRLGSKCVEDMEFLARRPSPP